MKQKCRILHLQAKNLAKNTGIEQWRRKYMMENLPSSTIHLGLFSVKRGGALGFIAVVAWTTEICNGLD
jgi:hypothetical protein